MSRVETYAIEPAQGIDIFVRVKGKPMNRKRKSTSVVVPDVFNNDVNAHVPAR